MGISETAGVFQLENGNWGYRFAIVVDGEKRTKKKVKDESGRPFKTEKQAARARSKAIAQEQANVKKKKPTVRKTFSDVFNEYCENGRKGKAYQTILSLIHIFSLVISTPKSWSLRTNSVCPIPLDFLILRMFSPMGIYESCLIFCSIILSPVSIKRT